MPAGGVGKKIAVVFLKAPLAEVVPVVGFALTDRYYREPAAAFAAPAAGAGDRGGVLRFHGNTDGIAIRVRITDTRTVIRNHFKKSITCRAHRGGN
jgi:hypothetical protein